MIIKESQALLQPLGHQEGCYKQVILQKGVVPGIMQCATACFNAGEDVLPHVHESMTEIFYVIAGTAHVMIDEQKHVVNQGDTFVVLAGSIHGIEFITRSKLFYFGVDSPKHVS